MLLSSTLIYRHQISGLLLSGLVLTCSLISGCTSWLPEAHKLDITQGNAIKRETLDKVQVGMNMEEIQTILGTPTLKDPFHAKK